MATVPASSPEIVPRVLQAEGILGLALGRGVVQVTVPLNENSDASPLQNISFQEKNGIRLAELLMAQTFPDHIFL